MAIRKTYGSGEDLGTWYDFDYDEELKLDVKVRIRRMNEEDRAAGDVKFGTLRKDRRTRTKRIVVPPSKEDDAAYYRAARCITDVKNWHHAMGDEAAAGFFAKELAQDLSTNDVVSLDGRLTHAIKEHLLRHDTGLLVFVTDKSVGQEEESIAGEQEQEAELLGNSPDS